MPPLLPPEAAAAYTALLRAQRDLGHRTACEREPELWWATDPLDQLEAIHACQTCKLLDHCRDYADLAAERHGIWAGEQRDQAARRRLEESK